MADEELTFGKRLRQLRHEAHMNQRDLATAVGIDFTYLSKIENGRMPSPAESTIINIAKILNADSDELLQLAQIVPSDLKPLISRQVGLPDFLRSISDLGPEEMSRLLKFADELRAEKRAHGEQKR